MMFILHTMCKIANDNLKQFTYKKVMLIKLSWAKIQIGETEDLIWSKLVANNNCFPIPDTVFTQAS